MTVEYALQHRKSCRSFLDQPVDSKLLRSIIQQASRAPSNGNLQPWQLFVLMGDALAGQRPLPVTLLPKISHCRRLNIRSVQTAKN